MQSDDDTLARRLGQVIDSHWTLERLLGSGGMAAVYAARAPDGAVAAVKLLHPEMGVKRDVRERFLREAYAANRVEHPGAVQVLGHGTTSDGVTYLVMELLEGEELRARVERHGTLPLGELLDYADQVLDVLAAAHARGIVHRDLKPDNLFVTTAGRVKVLDFGVARIQYDAPGDFRTRTGTALGTLPYMAPEQALGRTKEIDGRADLFSVGATLFRILARRRLHEAQSEAELLMAMASKSAPPLKSVAPHLPDHLCAVIDLALAFSREARYPDAATMQADVRALREGREPAYVIGRRVLTAREEPTLVEAKRAVQPEAAALGFATTAVAVAPAAPAAVTVAQPAAAAPSQTVPEQKRRGSLAALGWAVGVGLMLLVAGAAALLLLWRAPSPESDAPQPAPDQSVLPWSASMPVPTAGPAEPAATGSTPVAAAGSDRPAVVSGKPNVEQPPQPSAPSSGGPSGEEPSRPPPTRSAPSATDPSQPDSPDPPRRARVRPAPSPDGGRHVAPPGEARPRKSRRPRSAGRGRGRGLRTH